ncbi:MAG: hypothetical protein ACRD1R_08975 [Acidobacteriota bacterium]
MKALRNGFFVFCLLLVTLGLPAVSVGQVPPPPTLTLEAINTLSGPLYYPSITKFLGSNPFPPPLPVSDESSSGGGVGTSSSQFGALYTNRVTLDDTADDVKPTIMTLTVGTTDYTAIGYIKLVTENNTKIYRNYVATTQTGLGQWIYSEMPRPSDFVWSADPVLHENPYASGVAPERMYYTGVLYNSSCDVPPNAIAVWRSNDGGFTWDDGNPATDDPAIIERNDSSAFCVDKPDVEVSWYSGTRGYVFVSYVKVNISDPTQNEVRVALSTDGGVTFGTPVVVTSSHILGTQMLIHPFTGRVYVVWSDFATKEIRMSFSDDNGQTWTAPETAASGEFVVPVQAFLNANVRALTIPHARLNHIDNKICVVWHEWESSAREHTDIFYTAKSSSGWQIKKKITATTINDQFQPAVDFDDNGDLMVFYYDRSADSSNILYEERWARLDSSGNLLESGQIADSFQTDPRTYTNSFIGDYQDNWYWPYNDVWGKRFHGVFSGLRDIYAAAVR